jgi:hypothetical protein
MFLTSLKITLILGICILLRVYDPGEEGGLFRLRNVTIVGSLLFIIT